MGTRFRVGLTGPDARLGRVRAVDVANLLISWERAASRAAMSILGKSRTAGRRGRTIEDSVRFRLHSITRGSVVAELEVPSLEVDGLELGIDAATLGEMAVQKAIETTEARNDANPEIASALVQLAGELGVGERHESVWIEAKGRQRAKGVIDAPRLAQLRAVVERETPEYRQDRIAGTLVEADFERSTARLRTPEGRAVSVQFDGPLANEIQVALRHPAQLEGTVHFDPRTSLITSVEMRRVVRADQLVLGLASEDFWRNPTVEELARDRGVHPILDIAVLRDDSASEAEVDAFMAALER